MKNNQPKSEREGWPRYVVFDRALPVNESALAGRDPRAMSEGDLLGAMLTTNLEAAGHQDAADMVRAAMSLTPAARPHP